MPETKKPDSLAAALAELQKELPHIGKSQTADTGSYTYDYADLTDISEQLMPLLGKHGLAFMAKPTLKDGQFVLAYSLLHVSGESEVGDYPLPNGNPQVIGSAITYARRYVLCAVTGVAPGGSDDDGQAAAQHHTRPVEPPPPDPPDVQARKAVAKAWTASGRGEVDTKAIESDFAEWSGGELVTEATVPRLYEYAAWLEANKPEAEQPTLPENGEAKA